MGMTLLVVLVVSGALIVGALWGLYGRLGDSMEGFLVAMAGGALLVAAVSELIQPAIASGSVMMALAGVAAGALTFSAIDYGIDERWGAHSGGGLLAAITLDGVPENLALGVALIGAEPAQVAALAGSILLSNLPEAAGGARQMTQNGMSRIAALGLWTGAAALLSLAAIAGTTLFEGVDESALGFVSCFAAGAVVASLATEVFPRAYKEDRHWAGIATACGVILALLLDQLAG